MLCWRTRCGNCNLRNGDPSLYSKVLGKFAGHGELRLCCMERVSIDVLPGGENRIINYFFSLVPTSS
jgi:hypothetical protein